MYGRTDGRTDGQKRENRGILASAAATPVFRCQRSNDYRNKINDTLLKAYYQEPPTHAVLSRLPQKQNQWTLSVIVMETRQWILDQTTAHAQQMTARLYLLGELSSFQTLDLKKYLIQLIVSNTHV